MLKHPSIRGEIEKDNTDRIILITAAILIFFVFLIWFFFGYKYVWIPSEQSFSSI
ncbi:MAG: hypothetical protein QW802_01745 [Candidatus Altiarchaeota archaeon]